MNYTERGNRLKNRREELGYTTRDLAEKINVSSGTISNLEIQGSMPKLELAYKLARALNKSTDWILTGNDDRFGGARIPIIGDNENGLEFDWDEIDLTKITEFIDFPVQPTGRFYALRVNDDNLSPRILDGEAIIVDPFSTPQTGEDVVVQLHNGDTIIKTLLSIRDDNVFLGSINSLYQRIIKTYTEIRFIHPIVAVARSTMMRSNKK